MNHTTRDLRVLPINRPLNIDTTIQLLTADVGSKRGQKSAGVASASYMHDSWMPLFRCDIVSGKCMRLPTVYVAKRLQEALVLEWPQVFFKCRRNASK